MTMGGGGGGSTTTTQKSEPWKYQQPFYTGGYFDPKTGLPKTGTAPEGTDAQSITGIFPEVQNLYDSGGLAPAAYSGQRVADYSPEQQAANGLITNRALYGSPLNAAASSQLQDTIGGKYLDPSTNPGFQQGLKDIADAYGRGTAAQTDAAFARSGNLGGSAYKEMTGVNNQAFANNLTNFAGQLYGDERNRQMQGTLLSPSIANQDYYDFSQLYDVGARQQNQDQANINANMDYYNQEASRPASALAAYSQLIGGDLGKQTTQSTPYYSNPIGSSIGGALSGASLFTGEHGLGALMGLGAGTSGLIGGGLGLLGGLLSDERLKNNIRYIREENGHNIYEFTYGNDDRVYEGVMAQEVAEKCPEAVIPMAGYLAVNYDAIGVQFREIH